MDKNIARLCVESLDISDHDSVLEIGPGRGVLTEILLQKTTRVTAVEIDPSLCTALETLFGGRTGWRLIQGDFLKIPLEQLETAEKTKYKIIGNLPYAVVSPILRKVLDWNFWTKAVVMVQKEVGERIIAEPGNKDYGILSIAIQSRCQVQKIRQVSRNCFRPAPQVESVVLQLTPLIRPRFDLSQEKNFFKVVRAGFSHRRKTISNSLTRSLKVPSETVRNAIQKCGLSCEARAESFTIEDFKNISEILYDDAK